MLEVWAEDNRHYGVRNYALLRLLIYTGLRSAEVVALRWEDIDLDAQLVRVRQGKGDKERIVAIADVSDNTKQSLVALRALQADQYECVFPRFTNGPNPQFAADIPMNALTWQTYNEGKAWFKTPSSPASVQLSTRVHRLEKYLAQFEQSHPREYRNTQRCLEALLDSLAQEDPTKKEVLDSLELLRLACKKLPRHSSALQLTTDIEVIIEDLTSLHGYLISMPIPN